MSTVIAIVEDDLDQQQNYAEYLQSKGFETHCFSNVSAALEGIPALNPDIALLDVVLEDDHDGGFTVCTTLLDQGMDIPIVFLTDRSEEIDQGFGFRIGAWDYQTKPISLSLLAERLKNTMRIFNMRRVPINNETKALQPEADLVIDHDRQYVTWKGKSIALTAVQFQVFVTIVDSGAAGCSYDDLCACTRQGVVTTGTINSHVKNVRKKFNEIDEAFNAIRNKPGFGYRWELA
ncbi:MAG: response regulator [Oleiphilaceae bacterium]|nr:response regulator [Oleiphilaceae bacterium]